MIGTRIQGFAAVLATGVLATGLLGALATPARAAEVDPIDKELARYWNVEQAVPSLQNPLFERKGGFEGSLHFGVVPNDSFYLPVPIGGRLAYFLTDTVSVEAGASYLLGRKSDLLTFLECASGAGKTCTSLVEDKRQPAHMTMLSSLDLAWAPFHGKVGIFTQKLSSFDLGISAGVGLVRADIDAWKDQKSVVQSQFRLGPHWGAGFRFYLTRWANLRIDYKQFTYKPNDAWLSPVEFTVGLGFLTK